MCDRACAEAADAFAMKVVDAGGLEPRYSTIQYCTAAAAAAVDYSGDPTVDGVLAVFHCTTARLFLRFLFCFVFCFKSTPPAS